MPDLLTHTLLHVALPAGRLRRPDLGAFAFGAVLPDLCSRVPSMALSRLAELLTWEADLDWVQAGLSALHQPLGYSACVVALVAALPARLLGGFARRRLGVLLLLGGAVHLVTDLFQAHVRPGYRYLYPFSMETLDIGWFAPELGFLSWPVLIPWAYWAWRRAPR